MFKHKLKICFSCTGDNKKKCKFAFKINELQTQPVHPVSVPGSAAVHYTWLSPPLWFLWIHQDNIADRDTDQNTVSICIWQAVTDLVGHSDLKYCAAVAVSDGVHFGRPASSTCRAGVSSLRTLVQIQIILWCDSDLICRDVFKGQFIYKHVAWG